MRPIPCETPNNRPGGSHLPIAEVERKFKFDAKTLEHFRANVGMTNFKDRQKLGRSQFEDTYFDRDNVLSSKEIWVRRREGKWEAKVRTHQSTGPAIGDILRQLAI